MNTVIDGLSAEVVKALVDEGVGFAEIARRCGKSRQYVQQFAARHGIALPKTPRRMVGEEFPWKVPSAMQRTPPYRRMRDHGEFMATGGEGMSEEKKSRLRSWYAMLRQYNYVLEFDPELPPTHGVSPAGGFAYRPREQRDGAKLLIRLNEHTRLTSNGKKIWVFPPKDP
ncbi:XRE family transcriptional regulator [Nocardia brasiliensis]|uniref:XRE family transcriptional regulator n=1 Tax=Nocardia brasiliensis TaxID=37326 RepID=UPI00366FC8C8